jgi:transcriptional regulator with XRE-family HTH domain
MGNRRGAGMYPVVKFGNMLRKYREAAGLSLERLGERMGYSGSFLGQVERAERPPLREVAERADEALGTAKTLTWLWDELLEGRVIFPEWFDWPQYEEKAGVLRAYELSVVHGLLQTEDYSRALLGGDETAVAARMARQRILTREAPPPPRLRCLLAETVLHYRVGDARIMREQLDHLVACGSDRVSVQIVPNGINERAASAGAFILATFENERTVGYVETAARGMTLGAPDDVRTLVDAFDDIRSQALPVGQSRDLIARTAEERWT